MRPLLVTAILGMIATASAGHAQPQPSFRCAGAVRALDRAICASEDLAASERTLAERVAALRGRMTSAGYATVVSTQAEWERTTEAMCLGEGTAAAVEPVVCLIERYSARLQDLDVPTGAAADLRLEGRLRFRGDIADGHWEEDVYPVLVAGPKPAVAAFNAHVARELKLDRPLLAGGTPPGIPRWRVFHRRGFEIASMDKKILSLPVFETWDIGGEAGGQARRTLNWNVARNRPLRFDDLFRQGTDWRTSVVAAARAELQHQLERDAGDPDPSPSAVERVVSRIESWTFRPGTVVIQFDPDTVAKRAEGEFQVEIALSALEPYLAPGAPLPDQAP